MSDETPGAKNTDTVANAFVTTITALTTFATINITDSCSSCTKTTGSSSLGTAGLMNPAEDLTCREHAPVRELCASLQCVWELPAPHRAPAPQLIVPDCCMELVVNISVPIERLNDDGRLTRQPRTLLVGEVRRPVTTRPTGRVRLLGIRFRPGASGAFLNASLKDVVDDTFDDAALHSSLPRRVRSVQAADPADRPALLQRALLDRVQNRVWEGLLPAAIRRLVAEEVRVKVEALAQTLGVTRRHLERLFIERVGVSPKARATVLRFRRVLRSIDAHSVDLAGVASHCGYYDQAHLIRDFTRFTGRTPRARAVKAHSGGEAALTPPGW